MSAITMGGVSKACKGIHLSEDIFAGFNYVLRGGEATQADYIQARVIPDMSGLGCFVPTRVFFCFVTFALLPARLGGL